MVALNLPGIPLFGFTLNVKGEKERGQSSFGEVTPAGQVAIVVEDEKRVGDQVTRDTGQLESVNNFCKIMSLDKDP